MSDAAESFIRRYEWTDLPPSIAVVETISEDVDRDPTDLPTLNDAIDTDALDALCTTDTEHADSITVSFVYADRDVTVLGDGTVIVTPTDEK